MFEQKGSSRANEKGGVYAELKLSELLKFQKEDFEV
jgi:hypothetical protein